MYQIAYNELNGMIINLLKVFELYTMKFQNLNFTSWILEVFGFYALTFQNLYFTP